MEKEEALFDRAAPLYDEQFTTSEIGKQQRERVYYWMDKFNLFSKINSLFEINCGTGFDAQSFYEKGIKVSATDASPEMIEYAKLKRAPEIDFFTLDFKELDSNWVESNALFSNFGGLNCINSTDLNKLADTASKHQKKGDFIVWVIMPKFCMMESLYLLSKFKLGSLFRRNTNKGIPVNVDGTEVLTYYHSPKSVKKMLSPNYTILATKPVAYFLPPSYLETFFKKRKSILNYLIWLERSFANRSFYSGFSDHYILIAEKK